jgi:acetolactate synthase-1/2/3 large subunit
MSEAIRERTGGQILIDQLVAQGVDRLTCVPGESYLAALDALYAAPIDVIVCRQEAGAAIMAEADGKLTGRPGICFVTRGPGATNAAHGLHIAAQDSTPMILFAGQVGRGMREREAFQEIDFRAVFGSIAKWVVEVDDPARLPEFVTRAFRTAMQGRPGPVVISLPEDMLTQTAAVADAPHVEPAGIWPGPESLARFTALLGEAERPIVILGGSRWSEEARGQFIDFAERHDLPVTCSFRRAQLFPADHPNFVGDVGIAPNPALAERIRSADLVLLLGGRFSEMPSSSYSLLGVPTPRQRLVHVHPSAEELGRIYQPALAIQAAPADFCAALAARNIEPARRNSSDTQALRASYVAWSETPANLPGRFQYGQAVIWLREHLPDNAIICNGAGNFTGWIHRYYRFRAFGTQLAPTSGSMGYGVPAAVIAKRRHPDRVVIAVAGDGDFLMNGQEFATAVQFGVPIIVIVIDNQMYGTIRMHQEVYYPGRVSATALTNPDFAAYAEAFGGHGERVETTGAFAPAFERALASGKPAILHCLLDPQAITPTKTLDQLSRKS